MARKRLTVAKPWSKYLPHDMTTIKVRGSEARPFSWNGKGVSGGSSVFRIRKVGIDFVSLRTAEDEASYG
jgi:hypothetical protein